MLGIMPGRGTDWGSSLKQFILCNCNLGINSFLWILEAEDGVAQRQGPEGRKVWRVGHRVVHQPD